MRNKGRSPTDAFKQYPVLIRDEGYACHLRVGSLEIARQILVALSRAFAFKTSEPIHVEPQSAQCTFRVAYGSQLSHHQLVRLIAAIPGVRVRPDTAGAEPL